MDPGRFRVNIVTFTRSYDLSDQTFVFTVRLIKTLAEFTPSSSRFRPSGYGGGWSRVGLGNKQTGWKKSEGRDLKGESIARILTGNVRKGRSGKEKRLIREKGKKSKVGNLEKKEKKKKETRNVKRE